MNRRRRRLSRGQANSGKFTPGAANISPGYYLISAAAVGIGDVDLACCRKQHLPKYMVPRSGVIIDAMPLNANGKIAKPMLSKLTVYPRMPNGTYGIL